MIKLRPKSYHYHHRVQFMEKGQGGAQQQKNGHVGQQDSSMSIRRTQLYPPALNGLFEAYSLQLFFLLSSSKNEKTISHSLLFRSSSSSLLLPQFPISISKCTPQSPSQSPPLHSPLSDQIPPLILPPSISVSAASGVKPLGFHPLNVLISTDFISPLLPVPVGRFLLLSLPMEVPPSLTMICL